MAGFLGMESAMVGVDTGFITNDALALLLLLDLPAILPGAEMEWFHGWLFGSGFYREVDGDFCFAEACAGTYPRTGEEDQDSDGKDFLPSVGVGREVGGIVFRIGFHGLLVNNSEGGILAGLATVLLEGADATAEGDGDFHALGIRTHGTACFRVQLTLASLAFHSPTSPPFP